MSKFSLGLCSVSFRKCSALEILKEMQKAELSIIEWGSDVHAPCRESALLKELSRMQKDHGVSPSSYGTYFKIGRDAPEEILPYIEAANILGTSTLRIWAGEKNSEDFSQSEKEDFFKDCRRLAEIAKREGVTLCTECHIKTFTNRFQSTLELMGAVNSPSFQTYWQPNQFRDTAYNLASADALSAYTKNVHLFHWTEKEKLPLAEGIKIWKSYLQFFSGKETLLLEFMPDGKPESLKGEAHAARELIRALQ